MLDEPDTSTDSRDPDLPTPPRGRRAASRPAGPPKPVTPEPLTPEPLTPEPLTPESDDSKAEAAEPENAVPENAVPEKAVPEMAVPEKAGPGDPESADLEPVGPEQSDPDSSEQPLAVSMDADGHRSVDATAPDDRFEAELRARLQAQLGAALAEGEPAGSGGPEHAKDVEKAEIERAMGLDSPDVEEPPARRQTSRRRSTTTDAGDAPRRRSRRRAVGDSDATTAEGVGEPSAESGAERPADVADLDAEAVEDVESTAVTAGADDRGEGEIADVAAPAIESSEDSSDEASEGDDDSDGDDSDGDDSDGDESDDEHSGGDASGDDQSTGARRRRRRRGGRRRRKSSGDSGDADDSAESSDSDDDSDADESDDQADDNGDDDGDEAGSTGRRRRRRRRRRGEDTGGEEDPDTDVVVKVREPRRSKAADEVTGIEGSTRMEAKRQRRREGRAAGRRRTPILSEAEFLARRESVERTMVIRQNEELAQIAVLEDSVLVEHYVDRASATSLIGNVYLGRVQNVLPSMEAAFIDIGRGRNAVLYAGEVDWDSFGAEGQQRKVENVLKSGQTILVQVTKDPVGAKGARLTNNISLPGRYIVYSPGGHLSGISRKLPDTERKRLKGILSDLVGEDSSVIVRTAAEGASEDELVRDVNRLKAQWEAIEKKVKGGVAPAQLYAEPDATVRIVRDLFTEDFGKLIILGNGDTNDAYDMITAYVGHVAPHLAERIERWDEGRGDVFAAHRIDEQIAKALERKVYLPSGGSLVIDRTEAMTVIDVNTGKFTGSGGNLEATVTSNNLEAAEEVVRQLRLRDIGGIIVIDFIDMVLPSNRELLLRRLVECLGRDRTRHQVAEVTSLGLVQMTRKKIGTGLAEAFTVPCEVCKGRGFEVHDMPVESQSQADGGERRGRRGRGRGGSSGSGNNAAPPQDVAPSSSAEATQDASGDSERSEPDPVEAPSNGTGQSAASGRSRRRGRGRSNEREEPAAEASSDGSPRTSAEKSSAVEPQVDEPTTAQSPREESSRDEAPAVESTPGDLPQADVGEVGETPATEEPPA